MTDVVWTAALVLAPSSTLLIAVAAGVLVSQTARRLPLRKIAFNAGQFVLAMWVAQTLFHSIPHGGALDPVTWGAAAAAMAVNFVINESLVALVISLVERTSMRSVILESLGLDVLHSVGNVAIAGLFLGGATPGILVGIGLMLYSYAFGPPGIRKQRATLGQMAGATRAALLPLMIPVIIVGGVAFGVITPAEAGMIAVTYILVVLLPLLIGNRRPGVRQPLARAGEHTEEVLARLASAQPA